MGIVKINHNDTHPRRGRKGGVQMEEKSLGKGDSGTRPGENLDPA